MRPLFDAAPILTAPTCSTLFRGSATVISSPKTKGHFLVVVATPGLFIFSGGTDRKHRLEQFIPILDIKEIFVFPSGCGVTTADRTWRFEKGEHFSIAAAVIALREKLVDNSINPLAVRTSELVFSSLSEHRIVYETNSILCDRMLACLARMAIGPQPVSLDMGGVKAVIDRLLTMKTRLEFTRDFGKPPYMGAIAGAVAIDEDLTEIKFSDVPWATVSGFLRYVLKHNSRISRVVLGRIDFSGLDEKWEGFVKKEQGLGVHEWVFEQCRLDSRGFSAFFTAFNQYGSPVTVIGFDRCQFNQECFGSVTDTLLCATCFHSLESLSLTDVQFQEVLMLFILAFARSESMLKSQTLKTLRIADSCLDVAGLLAELSIGAAGITALLFPGNVFRRPINPSFVTFLAQDVSLDVSNCGFLKGHLFDLFKALAEHSGRSLSLAIAAAAISNDVWMDFLERADQLILPTLTSLTWNLNRITPTVVAFFAQQPSLRELSISDCIGPSDLADLLPHFAARIPGMGLTKLVWRASCSDTRLGPAMTDVLLGALQRPMLSLDITGQQVGLEGVRRVLRALPASMAELAFDGCGITDLTKLREVLRELRNGTIQIGRAHV
jgi:hypothetical protein